MPARASLVSGKQVHEHGVWGFANPELRHGQSHVRNIRNSGYKTGIVGKTHLWRHGKGHASEHLEEMHDWGYVDAREATGPSESINTDSRYTDHLAEKGLLDLHRAYLTTYLTGQRRHVALPWELPPTNLPTEDHLDMFISGLAEEWIEDHDSTDPFYLTAPTPSTFRSTSAALMIHGIHLPSTGGCITPTIYRYHSRRNPPALSPPTCIPY